MSAAFVDFLSGGLSQIGWGGLAIYLLIATQLTIFSVTLYLHRSLAHRGVDFHPVIAHFFRFWLWLTTAMVAREWAAVHRKHHAKCETEEDPHSPMVKGIGKVFWHGVDLYREATRDRASIEQYGKGCPDDWIERKLYTARASLDPALLLLLLFVLFGFKGVAAWAIQMAWIPFWAAGVINGLGHWWGYRNFHTHDTATNLSPWGVWIGGEELHNNHHAFPSSAKFALRRWEFDIGWAVISLLRQLRLAKVLRVAPSLDIRPNIPMPDTDTLKALLAHRFQAMTDFHRGVLAPALREEFRAIGKLPRRLRRGLQDDGRWLSPQSRQELQAWVAASPRLQALIEYRQQLAALLEARSVNASESLQRLQAWCQAAEASGIQSLQNFASRLRGYRLRVA
ncbi:acyl-CoA desaturase [Lysobacteraceae bacterium NML08-0793]|nr:acyl-CoA desaturase [Xanthomonadaceae bacterium NML08-0793]